MVILFIVAFFSLSLYTQVNSSNIESNSMTKAQAVQGAMARALKPYDTKKEPYISPVVDLILIALALIVCISCFIFIGYKLNIQQINSKDKP